MDLADFVRPTLTLIDSYRVLLRNGPTGGDLEDVLLKKTLVAGTDPVALDAYVAQAYWNLDPPALPYLKMAADRGLGSLRFALESSLLWLHFCEELDRHAVLLFGQPVYSHHLSQVLAIFRIPRIVMRNGHIQPHAFGVCADGANEIDAFARYVSRDVDFFDARVFRIGRAYLERLAYSDAPAAALVRERHGR